MKNASPPFCSEERMKNVPPLPLLSSEERTKNASPLPSLSSEEKTGVIDGATPGYINPSAVANVTVPPYSSVGRLYFVMGNMQAIGSAAVIANSVLITAAHNVASPTVTATNMMFQAQFAGAAAKQSYVVSSFFLLETFFDWSPEFPVGFDVAMLTTTQGITIPALNIGVFPGPPPPSTLLAIGYPANPPFNGDLMAQSAGPLLRIFLPVMAVMGSSMAQGGSGGPWLTGVTSTTVIGVTSIGKTAFGGPILTSSLFTEWVCDLSLIAAGNVNSALSLPGCGSNTTTPFYLSGVVYFGCNGYLYAVDPFSWELIATNPLTGLGRSDVQFCTDGTNLFAGVNGNVMQVDITSLSLIWKQQLPQGGSNDTWVIWMPPGVVIVGCNGYLFEYSPTGQLLGQNNLSGFGGGETRLSACDTSVTVGLNGSAVGVSLDNFAGQSWSDDLAGSGHNLVNVLCVNGMTYAGTNGYLYQIDEGGNADVNALSGLGNEEVRLATDGTNLFVGTSGCVTAFPLADITVEALWKVNLPTTATVPYSPSYVVDVLYSSGMLFAGCNGVVSQLDPADDGSVLWTKSLASSSPQEVRLAADPANPLAVYAGCNGYAYRLLGTTADLLIPAPPLPPSITE